MILNSNSSLKDLSSSTNMPILKVAENKRMVQLSLVCSKHYTQNAPGEAGDSNKLGIERVNIQWTASGPRDYVTVCPWQQEYL